MVELDHATQAGVTTPRPHLKGVWQNLGTVLAAVPGGSVVPIHVTSATSQLYDTPIMASHSGAEIQSGGGCEAASGSEQETGSSALSLGVRAPLGQAEAGRPW